MPIKKTTTEGPKAKLMKQTIPALRKKAKALGVSDYTKRTKENLVVSIMLAEARKKRGMGGSKPGRPVTKKTVSRKKVADNKWNFDWQYNEVIDNELPSVGREDQERFYKTRKTPGKQPNERDATRFAKQPGKRVSKSGKTYYEYRANRADISPTMHGDYPTEKALKIIPTIEKALDLEVVFINYWETIHGDIAQFESVKEFVVPHFELNETHRFGKEELSKLLKIPSFRYVQAKRTVEYTVKSEFNDKLYATRWTYTVGF